MDAVHIHLLLTHFPIIGTLLGVAILAYGLFFKNDAIQKLSLLIFIAMALVAIPVFLTGEGAEEAVENLPGVTEKIIHEHEELAETAIWFMGILGILAIVNWYALFKNYSFAKLLTIVTLFVSLITFGFYAKVGNLGGQIRHTEIRNGNTNITNMDNQGQKDVNEEDDDD